MSYDRNGGPILRILNGPDAGKRYDLTSGPIVLGREKDCQIVLAAKTVSKKHAEIRRAGSHLVIMDLVSRNETQVNGITLKPKTPIRLHDGDKITICDFAMVYEHPLLRLEADEESSSTILGSIELKSSNSFRPSVRPEDTLKALLAIVKEIGHTLQYREVLDKTLAALFSIFPQADRGFVLLSDPGVKNLIPQAVKTRDESAEPLTLSSTIFDHVMQEGKAILSTNLPKDQRFNGSPSLQGTELRTLMCAPLLSREDRPIGMIQIDTQDQKLRFSTDDLDVLAALAVPVALAVENARLHENMLQLSMIEASLKNAHEVQLALLPDSRPVVPGYEFWDVYEPAQTVGGDYYDYLPLGPNANNPMVWAVAIADVSGKGMPAAILMAKISAEYRACLLNECDPRLALDRLNRQLYDDRFPDRFVTFLLVILDAIRHKITVVNAGHMAPIIRRASGQVEVFGQEDSGTALTILENTQYQSVETTLGRGDVVVLYTDGVSEAMNPEDRCFETEGIARTLANAPSSASAVGEALLGAVKEHAAEGPQSDDIGIVCFGRL